MSDQKDLIKHRKDLNLSDDDFALLDSFRDGRKTFGAVIRQLNVDVSYMTFGTVQGILKQLREAHDGPMFMIFYMHNRRHEDGQYELEVRKTIFIRK